MKINKLTITGADDATNQDSLLDFSNNFGFVEWGILFSKTKLGEKRYPTLEPLLNKWGNFLSEVTPMVYRDTGTHIDLHFGNVAYDAQGNLKLIDI